MDKYYGINRPETHSTSIEYEIIARNKKPQKLKAADKESRVNTGFLIRCAVCVLIVAVCLIGKFTSVAMAQTASDFIKDELNRDSIEQLTEYIEDRLDK